MKSTMTPFKKVDGAKALTTRRKLGMNQTDFWTRLGVSQPCGSRYENGRSLPNPVALLYHIAYSPAHETVVAGLRGQSVQ